MEKITFKKTKFDRLEIQQQEISLSRTN